MSIIARCVGHATFQGQRCPVFVDQTGTIFVQHDRRAKLNLPNLVTMCGYACSLLWLAGAPWWVGVAGLLADEADGRIARKTGLQSTFGSELDYSVDVTLTGLCAVKALGPWGLGALPLITWVQAAKRARGERPKLGSARAAMTLVHFVR